MTESAKEQLVVVEKSILTTICQLFLGKVGNIGR